MTCKEEAASALHREGFGERSEILLQMLQMDAGRIQCRVKMGVLLFTNHLSFDETRPALGDGDGGAGARLSGGGGPRYIGY